MFKSYLVVAIRMILKNKIFAAINIIGLAIGISTSLIIYLIVHYDLTFDKFHRDEDRIYRVVSKFQYSGETFYNSGVTMPLARAVQSEVTGLEYLVPFYTMNSDVKITADGRKETIFRNQTNAVYVPPAYFQLFDYHWVAGSPQASVNKPNTVVLTEQKATLYFPGLAFSEIIGKQLHINDTLTALVSGVVSELKGNTDLTFSIFVSLATLESGQMRPQDYDDWTGTTTASQLFVKLAKGEDAGHIEKQLAGISLKYNPGSKDRPNESAFLLQPFNDIHFNANFGTYFDNRLANRQTLYGLLTVAGFILLLGCINFINLSTAQASQRAKEMGIRKSVGSSKIQLMGQFLFETFVITLTATLLSVLLISPVLKLLKDFVPGGVSFNFYTQPDILIFIIALIIVVTALAGFYPAWVFSGFQPVQMLKSGFNSSFESLTGLALRKVLTVTQFVIAQVFIIAVLMVSMQLRYSLTKDPGFKEDAIIYFQTSFYDTTQVKKLALLKKINAVPGITTVSLSNNPIASDGTWTSIIKYKEGEFAKETSVQMKMGDTNYIKLYELKMLAGSNIQMSDSIKEFIINETYARLLGFKTPREAIGKQLEWEGRLVPVTGVVADFHQQSLHALIKPLAIGSWPVNHRTFNIGLQSGSGSDHDWANTIARINTAFKEEYPADDFEYSFQDDTIRQYYESERKMSFLLKCAAGVTVFISCLGLLGLTMYAVARRTKEIGIRKVLGASIMQIVQLISKDFILLVTLSFIIASPIAYWAISSWLQNFAYRVPVTWGIFVFTFLIQATIAMATVGSQALRAATANPLKSLKTE